PLLDGLNLTGAPIVPVAEIHLEEGDPGSSGSGEAALPDGPAPHDLFVLIFTSGSTGAPKAVRMTHRRAAAMASGSTWLGRDDVLYSAMPLFHGSALNAIIFPALGSGATIVLRPRFSASQFILDIRRLRAT